MADVNMEVQVRIDEEMKRLIEAQAAEIKLLNEKLAIEQAQNREHQARRLAAEDYLPKVAAAAGGFRSAHREISKFWCEDLVAYVGKLHPVGLATEEARPARNVSKKK